MTVPLIDGSATTLPWSSVSARLRARWGRVVLCAVLGLGAGLTWWVLTPRTYTANSRFVPQVRRTSQSQPLTGLVAQLGINVPGGDAMQSPQFYADLATSREVLRAVLTTRVPVATGDSVPVMDLIRRWKKPTISADDALQYLGDAVTTGVAPKTGVVGVQVTLRDRKAAIGVLDAILDELDRYNRDRRRSQSSAERKFTEERLVESRAALRATEDRMMAFLQRNREVGTSASARFERDRLDRDLLEQQQLYTTMSQANQQSRIEEVRDTPLLTIVESPDARERGNSRGFIPRVGVLSMTGVLLGLGLAFWPGASTAGSVAGATDARRRRDAA